jgi:hypothetical protein
MMSPAELARLEALENLVMAAELRANAVAGAIQNRSFVNVSTPAPTSVTNGLLLPIVNVAATVKTGGIFLGWFNIPWSTGTNGDTITWALELLTGTGPLTFTNGTQVANAGNVQVSNAAGGALIATGGGTSVNAAFYTGTQPVLTGILSGNFSWSGIVTASIGGAGVEAVFPTGNNVILQLRMSAAHSAAMTLGNISVGLLELPSH